MKKKLSIFFLFITFPVFCFDWPQTETVQSDSFYSYFAQLRGSTISSSVIFSAPSQIKAAESGNILIILDKNNSDMEFFPSTLGTALILYHKSGLLTVYANIDGETIPENILNNNTIEIGTELGSTGNSAWQQGKSSLEFQIIDTTNNTAVNPSVLMPRTGKELPLYFSEIHLQNKNGSFIDISRQKNLPTGNYRIYKKRQNIAVPYKTRVSVNGAMVDEISYDILKQGENSVCVAGKKLYPVSILYPTRDLHLIGEANLSPGNNSLQLSLTDILGKETNTVYSINAY